ncbi:MAG TPA: HAMP domain-containing sensor histidine kinase [Bacteriovoracaceae bacterium]|nr:HAMP domain-containing sensor histidine kinase [Bacteriovoracaceae bacterium]
MPNSASLKLKECKSEIMDLWVKRALEEVKAAHHQENLALRDSLPEYLTQIQDALSTTIDRTEIRRLFDKKESTRIGKKHGRERAGSFNYTMDQVIFEYHILRQVICDVMERDEPLSELNREIIVCSVEQAVNDAATEYSDTLRDIQEQLTRSLAHDFRTPVSIAKMNMQLILRKPNDEEYCISKASKAALSLDRLNLMIEDLLDASRLKSGMGIALELNKDCDLNLIVQEVATDLNITYNNRIKFKTAGQCLGNWNESGLRRILDNLTSNAIKYGFPDRMVTITLSQTKDLATFSVHNHGEPIPKDEIPILFQQYRRSHSAEDKIGWGLGLTVVQGMTKAHKGEIIVVSTKEEGTTFTIKLPRNLNQLDKVPPQEGLSAMN